MAIRCAAKALIVDGSRILLNRCRRQDGSIYYDLPGGGQHPFESMEQAVRREVLEETGLSVRVLRFAAMAEEIYTNENLRQRYPDYCHRVMHIFTAEPDGAATVSPSEKDWGMEESEWISLDDVEDLPQLRPMALQPRLKEILSSGIPVWLGTEYVDWDHE